MKNVIALLVVMLVALQARSQEVIYGTVRYDGFQKITKGAYWSKRPEAKMVFEGSTPPGVTVYVLETDYFARFIDGENNGFDRNYIVLPAGTRVYEKNGKYYLAACGNCLEYLAPVNRVKIVETTKTVEKIIEKEVEKKVYVEKHDTTVLIKYVEIPGETQYVERVIEREVERQPVYEPIDNRRSYYYQPVQQQRSSYWGVNVNYQPDYRRQWQQPERCYNRWTPRPQRTGLPRIPNDADGHGWNNNGGLRRIPNDANGHGWNQQPGNTGGNQGGGGNRRPRN